MTKPTTERELLPTIISFLLGDGGLDGLWFGDEKAGKPFWWRHQLRAAWTAHKYRQPSPPAELVEEVTILRPPLETITLADGLRTRTTYLNGCNFKIKTDGNIKSVGAGCYLLINLIQGTEYYLWRWIKENASDDGYAPLPDEPGIHMVLADIMSQIPCKSCGGDIFKKEPSHD